MAGVIEKLYVGRTRTLLGNMAVLVRNAICIIADSALKYMSLSVLVLQNTRTHSEYALFSCAWLATCTLQPPPSSYLNQ